MRTTFEHKMWLLDMVDALGLHPRLAKLKGTTVAQEWEMLEQLIDQKLREIQAEKRKKGPR